MKCPLLLLFAVLLAPLASLAADVMKSESVAKPNIIFILTDDQKRDTLGCMGNTNILTPNIDRLAKNGVLFENNFVTTSICVCSRASILTGQYMRRHGIEDFEKPFKEAQWEKTYPALLRKNGYYTGFIGKFGVGNDKAVNAMADKFDYWKGVPGQGGKYFIDPKDHNRVHETAKFGQDSLEFLRGTPTNRPFCLSISFTAPHARDDMPHLEQFQPDDRDLTLYKETPLPVSATSNPEYFAKLPVSVQNSVGHERWLWRFDTADHYQSSAKNYYRLITGIDREVGRITEELKKRGLEKNTVIIFTSDNGYFLGDRQLSDKFFMYEESLRVPLIVCDPRESRKDNGRREKAMTLNIDLAPTMLALAGIKEPQSMQGQSLVPLLENKHPKDWRTEFFYEHHTRPDIIPPSEGVRTGCWVYIRWINENPVLEELFDLKSDSLEAHNVAGDVANRKILSQLQAKWSKYQAELK